jgi:hypothetical protein
MGRWVAKLGQLGRPARGGKEKEKGLPAWIGCGLKIEERERERERERVLPFF